MAISYGNAKPTPHLLGDFSADRDPLYARDRIRPAIRTGANRYRRLLLTKGGCTDAIVKEINSARSELKVQAYSFTSTPIAQAIAQAKDRGVKVTVLLDDSQRTEKYTGATYLQNHQVPVLIDAKHAIAHNKVMIIDGMTTITGSFNFTKSAEESNAENLLVIRDASIAQKYLANFVEHLKHGEAYEKK